MEAGLSRKAKVSQEWPWVSRWGGANIWIAPRVSQGGEASDGALPCKLRGKPRGVPGWWS